MLDRIYQDKFERSDRRKENKSVDFDRRSGIDRRDVERLSTNPFSEEIKSVENVLDQISSLKDEFVSKVNRYNSASKKTEDKAQMAFLFFPMARKILNIITDSKNKEIGRAHV